MKTHVEGVQEPGRLVLDSAPSKLYACLAFELQHTYSCLQRNSSKNKKMRHFGVKLCCEVMTPYRSQTLSEGTGHKAREAVLGFKTTEARGPGVGILVPTCWDEHFVHIETILQATQKMQVFFSHDQRCRHFRGSQSAFSASFLHNVIGAAETGLCCHTPSMGG